MARSLGYLLLICSLLISTVAFGKAPGKKVVKSAVAVVETIPPNWQKIEGFDCLKAEWHVRPVAGHPGYHAVNLNVAEVMCTLDGKCMKKLRSANYGGNDGDCLTGNAYVAAVPEGYMSITQNLRDASGIRPDGDQWGIKRKARESSDPARVYSYDYVTLYALRLGHFKEEKEKLYACLVQRCTKEVNRSVPGNSGHGYCLDLSQCYPKKQDTVPLSDALTRCSE